MAGIKLCPECGVPEEFSSNYTWMDSGVIVQSSTLTRRVSIIESENLDPLYESIGKIIGVPIYRQVIDYTRRGTMDYFSNLLPPEVLGMVRNKQLDTGVVADFMITTGQLNGYGKTLQMDFRNEGDTDDYFIMHLSEPFSLPLLAGMHAGGAELLNGQLITVTYKELSPDLYEFKAMISEYPEELKGRLPIRQYRYRSGDVELTKCSTCGGPAALSEFKWYPDRGVVIDSRTGRRMAITGPEMQDPIFEELEAELGESIPQAVIEAQRLFTRAGSYSMKEISDEGALRTKLALRGMGNLREIEIDKKGLRICIDNVTNYLMTVGLVQGLFEMAFDVDSHVEWEISEEGDLEVSVTPRTQE